MCTNIDEPSNLNIVVALKDATPEKSLLSETFETLSTLTISKARLRRSCSVKLASYDSTVRIPQ